MAYWEFLLQKEGDRDWLPLETAHVEISEGRYRIIAHTSYCETPVNIRLSRLITEPAPARRKTLKRAGQTSPNGLMVVIPFTHLSPGSWTVKCSAIAPPESPAQAPWEYGVQLEVLAIESGVEYWDTDLDEEAIAADLAAEARPDRSASAVTENVPDAQSTSTAPTLEAPETFQAVNDHVIPDLAFTATAPLEDLPLRLQLQHQALVAHARAPIVLQAQIMSFSEVEGLPGESTLWVQMRNPETGAVVHQAAKALSIATLPRRFDLPMTLPEGITTRLLVGELSLWTATEPPQVLAIQGFTVTLNLDALLEVVANQAERSPTAPFEDFTNPQATTTASEIETTEAETTATEARGLSTLSPREIPFRLVYLPSTGLTLPPVIYRPIDQKTVGAPSLPPFGDQLTRDRPPASDPAEMPAAPAKPLTLPPLGKHRPAADPEAPEAGAPAVELPSLERSPQPPTAATNPPAATAASTSEITFQPDFQSRFWERLSALAEAAQREAADRKAQLEAAGVETADQAAAAPTVDLPFPTFPESPDTINYEVVVYESEPAAPLPDDSATTEPLVEVLRPEEPDIEDLGEIPVPELVLSQGELVAGEPLPITVRLPSYTRRLAVKVWVTDIQSRTLIDRPRWLMNWTPSGNEQTALLQLQVPLGSIEARFEAIAIDLATQRESYKTSHVRSILPPNLPETDIGEPL